MKANSLIKFTVTALMTVTISHGAGAADQKTQEKEFKLPPPVRYLTAEQIDKITAQTQKIEIKPNEYTPKFLKYFHAEIKSTFGGTTYERQLMDITQSYFGLTIGDKVDEALNNFSKYAEDRQFLVGLNVKASVVPLVLKSSTKKKVDEAVLEKVKEGAVAAAAIKVQQGFEAKVHPGVAAGRLSEQEYQAMLATNIKQTTTAVANNHELINALAQPHLAEADRRIEAVAEEIILQELSVKFAWSPFKDDSIIIFGTVGKAQVNGNFKQGIRSATAFGGWANIGQTTQGTGSVQLGVQTAIAGDIKVTFESWMFHNRLPTRSGSTLLFNVVAMPEDVFENHQDITNLDSNLQKITLEIPSQIAPAKDTVYFATGDFNGDRSFGAGAIVRILPKISVQVEGTIGRDALYKSAFMEAILYHVNEKLTLYVANENVKDLKSAYHVENPKVTPGQMGAASVGASYAIGKWSLGYDVTAALNTTAGFKCFYEKTGLYDQDTCGVDTGVSAQVQWK